MLAAVLLCLAAPLPAPKPPPPPFAVGKPCLLVWHGSEWHATFHASGLFTCKAVGHDQEWVGLWKLDGRTVSVGDSPRSAVGLVWPPEHWSIRWSITVGLDGKEPILGRDGVSVIGEARIAPLEEAKP